jgi:hypothetical protein
MTFVGVDFVQLIARLVALDYMRSKRVDCVAFSEVSRCDAYSIRDRTRLRFLSNASICLDRAKWLCLGEIYFHGNRTVGGSR